MTPPLPIVPPSLASTKAPNPSDEVSELAPLWWYYSETTRKAIGPMSLVDFEKTSDDMDGLTLVWRYGYNQWVIVQECSPVKIFLSGLNDPAPSSYDPGINDETNLEAISLGSPSSNASPSTIDALLEKKRINKEKKQQYQMRKKMKMLEQNNSTIYISGLNVDKVTISALTDLFKGAGQIDLDDQLQPRIKLYQDQDGKLKGDALITYAKPESIDLAVKYFDGRDLNGKPLSVSAATFDYKKAVSTKRPPVTRIQKEEKLKKRQLIDEELRRRQTDASELTAQLEEAGKQKNYGICLKPLWHGDLAKELRQSDHIYDLIKEILHMCLSRNSMTKDLYWMPLDGMKKLTVLPGHIGGMAIVSFKDIISAEAFMEAVNGSELPWGPVKSDAITKRVPLPVTDNEIMEFELADLRMEHHIIEAFPHVQGTDHSGQMMDATSPASTSNLKNWSDLLTIARETLLPKPGSQSVPVNRIKPERNMDPMIRLQRRVFAYTEGLPLLPVILQGELTSEENPVTQTSLDKKSRGEELEPPTPDDDVERLDRFMAEVEEESSDEEFDIIEEEV